MAFLIYDRRIISGKEHLLSINNNFLLAGYNLLFRAWELNGKPIDKGWDISVNELIKIWSNNKSNYQTTRFLIDFDPNSKRRIGIIELLHIQMIYQMKLLGLQ